LWARGRPSTIAIMTTISATPPSAAPPAVEGDASRAASPSPEAGGLDCLARRLAEVAHAIRVEAGHVEELPRLAGVFANIENALCDLAAAAERSASAVIDTDRPPGARASQVPPTPPARALSWRLHGLANALRASREICPAVQSASRQHTRAQQTHRGSAPTGRRLERRLLGPST
jgi:hypothetical protein